MVLHLGHCGQPCPTGVPQSVDPQVDDMEWSTDKPDDVLPFLWVPQGGGNYLTLVDVTGVHFLRVCYCVCPTSQPFHMQLF
ncbi:hypothetical protein BS17DRAFT_851715 [Gyrodon lividus]|nr:hypothetical protein BS17DRAFT_851715 [Gyrodon lividus]